MGEKERLSAIVTRVFELEARFLAMCERETRRSAINTECYEKLKEEVKTLTEAWKAHYSWIPSIITPGTPDRYVPMLERRIRRLEAKESLKGPLCRDCAEHGVGCHVAHPLLNAATFTCFKPKDTITEHTDDKPLKDPRLHGVIKNADPFKIGNEIPRSVIGSILGVAFGYLEEGPTDIICDNEGRHRTTWAIVKEIAKNWHLEKLT